MSRTFVLVCLIVGAALAAAPVPGLSDALWLKFDRMTLTERQNAELSLQPGPQALAGAWDESREICRLWNSGDFDAALARLRGFPRFDDPSEVLVAVSWRKPVECPRQTLGTAVRIGTRDSIFDLVMDRSANGTLWAVTPCNDSGIVYSTYLQVCKSTDNGVSWSNVSSLSFGGANYLTAGSAACNGAYYQVSYASLSAPNRAMCARLLMPAGPWVHYAGDSTAVTGFVAASGDTIREMAECSQEDATPGFRVYLFGRTKNRLLYESWADSSCGGTGWHAHSTGVTTCDNGLDCTFSKTAAQKKLWASWLRYYPSDTALVGYGYFTTADTFFHASVFVNQPSRHYAFDPTSITAYGDSVQIAHTAPWGRCRVFTTNNAGTSWSVGNLTRYMSDTAEFPAVTARVGGVFAAAYRVRNTAAGSWVEAMYSDSLNGPYSTPDTLSGDAQRPSPSAHIRILPAWTYKKGGPTWVGPYAVGWIDANNGEAWCSTYTPPGVAESPAPAPLPLSFRALLSRGGANLCFENPADGQVRLRVFDGAGRLVRANRLTLPAGRQTIGFHAPTSGVYIAVLDAAGKTASTRFAAVR